MNKESTAAALRRSREEVTILDDAPQFIKMNQPVNNNPLAGKITFGRDGVELSPDSEWVLDIDSIKKGFSKFKGMGEVPKVMVDFVDPMPSQKRLRETDDDREFSWKVTYRLPFLCTSKQHKGVLGVLDGSTKGIVNVAKHLLDAINGRLDESSDEIFPRVKFSARDYPLKRFNRRNFEIVIEIVGWEANAPVQAVEDIGVDDKKYTDEREWDDS